MHVLAAQAAAKRAMEMVCTFATSQELREADKIAQCMLQRLRLIGPGPDHLQEMTC